MTDQLSLMVNVPDGKKVSHLSGNGERVDDLVAQQPDQILTIPEVAKYLKLSRSKVYSLVARHTLPSLRIGRNVRIRQSDLEIWLNQTVNA